MNLNTKAAKFIRSLMRELRISDHIVFTADEAITSDKLLEVLEGPHVGDGTPDAALFIAEEAFKAGYTAGWQDAKAGKGSFRDRRWDEFEPSEMAKDMS